MNPLIRHLELLVEAYGEDLPLRRIGAHVTPTNLVASAATAAPAGFDPGAARTPPVTELVAVTPAPRPALRVEQGLPTTTVDAPECASDLATLAAAANSCTRCRLAPSRTQVVFGEGSAMARVMFIGEAPGFHEDKAGRPFVGAAGQLLDRIIANGMGLDRSEVYIANVLKCRPPDNRDPEPDEVATCLPFLRQQIALLHPAVIVCLGRHAARALLATDQAMARLRGQNLAYQGIPVVATWHPAYLLRRPEAKVETWEDIKRVNRLLGRPEDPRQ